MERKGMRGMIFYVVVVLVLLGFLLAGWLATATATQDSRLLPIIMYHDVVPDGEQLDEYTVSATQLEEDLAALAREGWQTVRLSEVIDFVQNGATLPEKPVLLVFDDGYDSVLTQVLPLLEKYDARAVVSVIGARAQGLADGCDTSRQYMDWDALSQALASGRIELQSHSAQLHVFRARKGLQQLPDETEEAYAKMLLADMNQMDAWSEDAGVTMIKSFAYPYGFVEPLADSLMRKQGYEATMTSEPHINRIERNPDCLYRLGRFNRSGCMQTDALLKWLTP